MAISAQTLDATAYLTEKIGLPDKDLTRKRILEDSIDPHRDGHLFLAVKGERALASLSLVSVGPDLTMTTHDDQVLVR